MLDYVWANETTIPSNVGWTLFSPTHLVSLAVVACCVALLRQLFLRSTDGRRVIILRVMATSVVATELLRDLILAAQGVMGPGYLPLHLCSLSMFAYLAHAWMRPCRARDVIAEVGVVLLLPGTLSALLFPNWTALPPGNFIFVHSFFSHGMLAAYPLLLLWGGLVRPNVRHAWWSAAALVVVALPIAAFNAAFGCNFLFIMWPVADTPLELLWDWLGPWWRVGYAALVAMAVLLTYGLVGIWERRHPVEDPSR